MAADQKVSPIKAGKYSRPPMRRPKAFCRGSNMVTYPAFLMWEAKKAPPMFKRKSLDKMIYLVFLLFFFLFTWNCVDKYRKKASDLSVKGLVFSSTKCHPYLHFFLLMGLQLSYLSGYVSLTNKIIMYCKVQQSYISSADSTILYIFLAIISFSWQKLIEASLIFEPSPTVPRFLRHSM